MTYKRYFCLFASLFLYVAAFAQVDSSRSAVARYFFDGPNITCEFDARTYASALLLKDSIYVEFTDLNLLEGITHPETWSKEGWTMVQIGPEQFQIRKKNRRFQRQAQLVIAPAVGRNGRSRSRLGSAKIQYRGLVGIKKPQYR